MGISREDWDALSEVPGTIPRPAKREKPKKQPKPRKPLNKVNRRRAKEARSRDFSEQAVACRKLPCIACGCAGPSQAHHEPPRSVGGEDGNTVPLCAHCHARRHTVGPVTFWNEVGCSPEVAIAHVREQAGITIYG